MGDRHGPRSVSFLVDINGLAHRPPGRRGGHAVACVSWQGHRGAHPLETPGAAEGALGPGELCFQLQATQVGCARPVAAVHDSKPPSAPPPGQSPQGP